MDACAISVALCTFNGSRYIEEQLESILAQDRPVDEIVVSDDRSDDGTLDIVEAIASRASIPVRWHRNNTRLGVTSNFEYAISMCSGGVVFLSDQDDVWASCKVRKVMQAFEANKQLWMVFTDARLIDADGRLMNATLFEALEFRSSERAEIRSGQAFHAFARRNLATGATAAIRRELFDVARPFPCEWLHDEWLATLAAAEERIDLVESQLIDYRQHDTNLVGMRPCSWMEKFKRVRHAGSDFHAGLERRASVLACRLGWLDEPLRAGYRELLEDKLAHARVRSRLPPARVRRIPVVLGELMMGRYRRCSNGWRSAARDLVQRIEPRSDESLEQTCPTGVEMMRSRPTPACRFCGSRGGVIHSELSDHVYGAAGTWSMRRCLDPGCGACWLDPAPIAADLPMAYEHYYTHGEAAVPSFRQALQLAYARRRLGYPGPHRPRLGALLGLLPSKAESALYRMAYLPYRGGGRVLEIGCGSGEQLSTLRSAGWVVVGTEFDAVAAARANERGLDVRIGDVREMDLPEGSFDAIVMTHVIEHVEDPVGLLRTCRRLLSPEGQLLLVTPNAKSMGHRVYGASWRGLEPPRHLVVFTRASLRRACEAAGFFIESMRSSARDAGNMFFTSRRIAAMGPGEQIIRRPPGSNAPLDLRVLERIERVACLLGVDWGEELVVSARPQASSQ